jgi:hypothetical protein
MELLTSYMMGSQITAARGRDPTSERPNREGHEQIEIPCPLACMCGPWPINTCPGSICPGSMSGFVCACTSYRGHSAPCTVPAQRHTTRTRCHHRFPAPPSTCARSTAAIVGLGRQLARRLRVLPQHRPWPVLRGGTVRIVLHAVAVHLEWSLGVESGSTPP